MLEDDVLISILSSHLWENGNPYMHKSENLSVLSSSDPTITSLMLTSTALLLFSSHLT